MAKDKEHEETTLHSRKYVDVEEHAAIPTDGDCVIDVYTSGESPWKHIE